ncbi:hypothetical protein SAMN05192541_101674 [Bradyrhizobium arachidis]|uniref:Uncharacterized protein n=2 Tax=Bradyrhizobium arachidis TaxID=858423 RepID=A0AAE7TKV1_9BRAD|nr:hypothetical protein WN72_45665 [Bradyrhizobium arachidis]SFU39038.1 hypothetical protein SAMN05192541_101674 [Bradyrhizobium arachidis]
MRDTDETGPCMRFFLCEVVARIVAIYLCVDCGRMLRDGYTEREIRAFSPDLVDWLLDWSRQVVQRDTAPVSYWMEMGHQAVCLAACLVVAIFWWWLPNG